MAFQSVFRFSLLVILGTCSVTAYDYSDQGSWGQEFPECDGSAQSPVDIRTNAVVKNNSVPRLEFRNYLLKIAPEDLVLLNDGYTVKATPTYPSGKTPNVRGGNLQGIYVLQSYHFHWGSRDNRGSEHTIDGKRFSMEAHLVHMNDKYETVEEALENSDGILVFGVFFKATARLRNGSLRPIADRLHDVREFMNTTTAKEATSIKSIFPLDGFGGYFTYAGSLTTPPCSEAVTWIVYPEVLPITLKELQQYRSLRDEQDMPLVDNYRNLQPLNGRVITYVNRR